MQSIKVNNKNLNELIISLVLGIIFVFSMASVLTAILFTISNSYNNAILWYLPFKVMYNMDLYSLVNNYLYFISENYYFALAITFISALAFMFFIIRTFKDYKDNNKSYWIAIGFGVAAMLFVNYDYIKSVIIYNAIRLDFPVLLLLLFLFLYLPFFILTIIIFFTAKNIVEPESNNIKIKNSFIVIFCIIFASFSFYLFQYTAKFDSSKTMTDIKGIDKQIKNSTASKYIYIINQNYPDSFTIEADNTYKNIPISDQNINIIKKYINKNPETLIIKELHNYIISYYSHKADFSGALSYFLNQYKFKPDRINAHALSGLISNKILSEEVLSELEELYANPEYVKSKISYAFLAKKFRIIGNNEKDNYYSKLSKKTPVLFPDDKPLAEELLDKKRADNYIVNYKGKIQLNGKPSGNAIIFALPADMKLKQDTLHYLLYNTYDYKKVDSSGQFSLSLPSITFKTFAIRLPKDSRTYKISAFHSHIVNYNHNENIGTINIPVGTINIITKN